MERLEFKKMVNAILIKTAGDPARISRLSDSIFEAAVQECAILGLVEPTTFAETWKEIARYTCGSELPMAFAKRWNLLDRAPQLDLEAMVAPYRDAHRKELETFQADVEAHCLGWLFPEQWFAQVEQAIQGWHGDEPLKMDGATGFVIALQEASEGRSLAGEIRKRVDTLSVQTSKYSILRNRLQALAKDAVQVAGAVFELMSMYPMIIPPNELVELEPKIAGSRRKAEALVRVASHELFVEATVFTGLSPIFPGSCVDFHSLFRGEAQALMNKIRTKAEQLAGADRPTLLFVARGVALWGRPLEAAIRLMQDDSVFASISAVALADSHLCDRFEFRTLPSARMPLPQEVVNWLRNREKAGWRSM